MAIQFVTGLPRAGKTLWTIQHVKQRAEKEKRQVYTCNIPDVTISGWKTIDHPDKWLDEVPDSSIVIVDELQDFWGLNNAGSKVPLPILELSKHGKRGIDFYFITQEPELVHRTPRALCAVHWFVVRAFGTGNAAVYRFDRMQAHPEKVKTKGEKFPWRYPVEAFGKVDSKTGEVITPAWYKSADVHNVKRDIPRKLIALPVFVLIALGSFYGAYRLYGATMAKAKGGEAAAVAAAPAGAASGVAPGGPGGFAFGGGPGGSGRPPRTAEQLLASYVPRVPGVMHTAPAYDQITQVKRAPLPAACVVSKSKGCRCFTQSATPYPADDALCRQIVANGLFLDFVADVPGAGAVPAVGARSAAPPMPGASGVPGVPAAPASSGWMAGAGGPGFSGGAAPSWGADARTIGQVSDYYRRELDQVAAAERDARTGDIFRNMRGGIRTASTDDN